MVEYQTVFKDMNARIACLEDKNARLERKLENAMSQLQSKNEAKDALNDVRKLTRRLAALEGSCKAEFKRTHQK